MALVVYLLTDNLIFNFFLLTVTLLMSAASDSDWWHAWSSSRPVSRICPECWYVNTVFYFKLFIYLFSWNSTATRPSACISNTKQAGQKRYTYGKTVMCSTLLKNISLLDKTTSFETI